MQSLERRCGGLNISQTIRRTVSMIGKPVLRMGMIMLEVRGSKVYCVRLTETRGIESVFNGQGTDFLSRRLVCELNRYLSGMM